MCRPHSVGWGRGQRTKRSLLAYAISEALMDEYNSKAFHVEEKIGFNYHKIVHMIGKYQELQRVKEQRTWLMLEFERETILFTFQPKIFSAHWNKSMCVVEGGNYLGVHTE